MELRLPVVRTLIGPVRAATRNGTVMARHGRELMDKETTGRGVMVRSLRGSVLRVRGVLLRGVMVRSEAVPREIRAEAEMSHVCGRVLVALPVVTPRHPLESCRRIVTRTARSLFEPAMMPQRFP